MEVRYLGQGVYAFLGAVNLGAIVSEGFAVFVDAGLDEGPARKLWRWAEQNGVRPQATTSPMLMPTTSTVPTFGTKEAFPSTPPPGKGP